MQKIWLFMCLLAVLGSQLGYCGKMYSSHLFPYGGLNHGPFDIRKITEGKEGEGKAFYMSELHWLAEIYFI